MPALALATEVLQGLRALGPAHRIGHEGDSIRPPLLSQLPVHPHDHVHVLTDGVVPEASDLDQDLLAEDPERTGDDHERLELAPAHPREQEGAEVLEDLHSREEPAGYSHPHRL